MAQFVYTMNRVGKIVPPKRQILKDISLSFFPGAKIGVLGLNGAGKSTLLKIMAGVDTEIEGEAIPMPGIKIGYLPQEPVLDPEKTVRETVAEGLGDIFDAQEKLNKVYEAYADPDADFDALAAEQARLEAITLPAVRTPIRRWKLLLTRFVFRLGMPRSVISPAVKNAVWLSAVCCSPSRTCSSWTNRPTTWTQKVWIGLNSSCSTSPEPWLP